jgi:hypothetical protein
MDTFRSGTVTAEYTGTGGGEPTFDFEIGELGPVRYPEDEPQRLCLGLAEVRDLASACVACLRWYETAPKPLAPPPAQLTEEQLADL